jgi:amino acid permease
MTAPSLGLRDHLRLLAPLFALIAAVWALRLVLDAAGAPSSIVRLSSVTVAGAVSVLLAVVLMHFRRLGRYSNVMVATILLVFWTQLLSVLAIAFAAVTGIQNVFAAPEYSPRRVGPLPHIAGHLTFGLGFGILVGSAMACLTLWTLRRLVPAESDLRKGGAA